MSPTPPPRDLGRWYWFATVPFVAGAAMGCRWSLLAAMVLTTVQAVHFAVRGKDPAALGVQVRTAYFAMLLLGTFDSLRWVYWPMVAGTSVRVAFNYCFLARSLSLLPWNRVAPFTPALLARTFSSPPAPAGDCSR